MATLETLVEAVKQGEEAEAVESARSLLAEGVPVGEILEGMTAGLREVGEAFARMEMFLPEMTLAANAMQAVIRSIEPELSRLAQPRAIKGKVVIGTVQGDMHSIGKDIVVSLLRVQGFEVHDLGVDVDPLALIKKAREVNADAIGASALMTTTMPGQRVLVELLKAMGLRQQFHVILGGGPVTQEWVNKCEADSWGENAWTAVRLLERAAAERKA